MARKNAAQKKAAEEARQKLEQENPDEAARLEEERAGKSKKQMHRKDKPCVRLSLQLFIVPG